MKGSYRITYLPAETGSDFDKFIYEVFSVEMQRYVFVKWVAADYTK